MSELRATEGKPNGTQTNPDKKSASIFILFAALHVIRCGLPLLLLSGVSFHFLLPTWPIVGGVLVLLGMVGFALYTRRGCSLARATRALAP